MFDKMLNSNCPKVFTVASLDAPIEILNKYVIGTDGSKVYSTFFFIMYANHMMPVWDPGQRWCDPYTTTYRTFFQFTILRDMYAYVNTKWLTAVESVILVSLASVALTKQSLEHESLDTDVISGGGVCIIHLGNLVSAKGTKVDLLVLKVGTSWFHSNNKAVALNSPSSLDRNTTIMSHWLHSKLEDKVLYEGWSIVANQDNFVRVCGLELVNKTNSVDIIRLSKMLESFI
ncbi:hypothetical protein R3W88_026965 [Solanum pinnatisectum]|uniref:Uncharacterized protein n=1 Tax=Solanum pinnatisectum TaxID=50273 RepID=A0AAV9LEY4_9SOLN|nr:hypothetical protein R3W88_026965 [Solanum pinnatisectum]